MVRLAWSRVHNGVFQQPRRSIFGVAITPGQDADLTFLGRMADSLTFSVSHAVALDGYADPSVPGFRYDLAADEAVVLPQVAAPPPAPTSSARCPRTRISCSSRPGRTCAGTNSARTIPAPCASTTRVRPSPPPGYDGLRWPHLDGLNRPHHDLPDASVALIWPRF